MTDLGGVWVPGAGDTPREDYENALERACSVMVHFGGMDAMNVVADVKSYRNQTVGEIENNPQIPAEAAAEWLDAQDRSTLPLPSGDCGFFEALDDATASALREDELTADDVVRTFGDWVEKTTREFENAHGLPDGWTDVEVDDVE